jgi:hypothetical protein
MAVYGRVTKGIVPPQDLIYVVLGALAVGLYWSWVAGILLLVVGAGVVVVSTWRRMLELYIVLLALWAIGTCAVWLALLLQMRIGWAAIVMLVLFPVYGAMGSHVLGATGGLLEKRLGIVFRTTDWVFLFGAGMSLSLAVTLIALVMGHLCRPNAWVPQTLQMLLCNVVCDGLTLIATLKIMKGAIYRTEKRHVWRDGIPYWAREMPVRDDLPILAPDLVREEVSVVPRAYPIPLACLLDIAVGALLACVSLWAGLAFTAHALSPVQVTRVLIARSVDGSEWAIGPYFWAMQTAFLPTLAYMTAILLMWVGKAVLLPVHWVFGRARVADRPLALAAGLVSVIAALFGVLAYTAASIQEAREQGTPDTPVSTPLLKDDPAALRNHGRNGGHSTCPRSRQC